MSKAAYQYRGEAIDFENGTGAKIEALDLVAVGGHVGVAAADIENGEIGGLHMTGIFEVPKDAAAINLGADVYLVSGEASATQGGDGVFMGYAVAATDAADETVLVKLMG